MAFKLPFFALALPASFLVGGAAPLVAQSLGDVARQEEARRKEVKHSGKVYTNKDLGPAPPATPSPASEDAKRSAADASGNKGAADGPEADTKEAKDGASAKDAKDSKDADHKDAAGAPGVKDQAYWSGRQRDFSMQLTRDESYAEALQSRINALTADFSARDDPAQRNTIARDRQKALDELDRLRKAIQDDKKALADFQEEARRAGVPPGWLR